MITMMMSINPSDMALSPMGGRRVKTRRSAAEEKSIYRPLVPVREPGMASPVIPGWSEGPDLRCAIAHRGISRFRVRCGACHRTALGADPVASPRNDGGWVYFGCSFSAAELMQ